jgi:hypothetical protein
LSEDFDLNLANLRQNNPQFNLPPPEQEFSLPPAPDLSKLSRGERWLFDVLPGIDTHPVGKPVSKIMSWFNEGWRGKVLGYLDIGAEGLERTLGLVGQYSEAFGDQDKMDELNGNLKAAWQAGSLYLDVSNVPKFTEDGLQWVTDDMPGISGVVYARRQIAEGRDLEEVRGEIYDSMGMMALRAQMNDALFHMVLDPLNILMPWIKPIERTKDALTTISNLATSGNVLTATQEFGRLSSVVNSVDDLADIAKLADDVDELARLGTNVDEIGKLGRIIDDLGLGASKEDVVRKLDDLIAQYNDYKQMTPGRQKLLQLTGNAPGSETPVADLPRWQQVLRRINPLGLTPTSRADGLLNIVTDNLALISNHADDPVDFAKIIQRVADGTMGPEFGHMVVRSEGRLIQSAIQSIAGKSDALVREWVDASKFERPLLNIMEQALGDTAGNIIKRSKNGESAALFQQFTEAVAKNPEINQLFNQLLESIGRAEVTPKDFATTLEMFANQPALMSKNGMNLTLYVHALESVAQESIITFGVKPRGAIGEWADALKKVETIAFLRTNPTYPVRNLINNATTMIGRGIFNSDAITKALTRGQLDDFWNDIVGFVPARAAEGIGLHADDIAKAPGTAGEALAAGRSVVGEQVAGGKKGLFTRGAQWIEDQTAGRLKGDFGTASQKIESWCSERGFASGYFRWMKDNWFAGGKYGFSPLPEGVGRRIGTVRGIDDFAEVANNFVQGTMNPTKLDEVLETNMRLDIGNIAAQAKKNFPGLDDVLIDGTLERIAAELPDAVKKGQVETTLYFEKLATELQEEAFSLLDSTIKLMVDETAALAKADGPAIYPRIMSEMVDDGVATHTAHAMETARMAEDIRKIDDPIIRSARWRRYAENQRTFWNRHNARQNSRIDTLAAVAKEHGIASAERVSVAYKDTQKGWNRFFNTRERLFNNFYDAVNAGKQPKKQFTEILDELDGLYSVMLENEDAAIRTVDGILAEMMDPGIRPGFLDRRAIIADARKADRLAVAEFRAAIRDLPQTQVQSAYEEFQRLRTARWSDIKSLEDAAQAWTRNAQQDPARFARPLPERTLQAMEELSPRDAILRMASEEGIASQSFAGAALDDKQIVGIYNKYARGEYTGGTRPQVDEFETLEDFLNTASNPTAAYEEALDARKAYMEAPAIQGSPIPHLDNAYEVLGLEMNMGAGMDELLRNRVNFAVEALADATRKAIDDPAVMFSDLDPADARQFTKWLNDVKGAATDGSNAALKAGAFTRDSALLNYSRRYNYNTWLGTLAPYEFWATQTAYRWALHSFDRPGMLSAYLRMTKMLETGYRPESGFPSRLKGSIRVKAPFLPDWFGDWIGDDIFINPGRVMLPFENLGRPLDERQYQQMSDSGSTERVLDELLNDRQITQQEYETALTARAGPVWDRALGLVQLDDTERRSNAFDFMSMVTSPHAPLMSAYHRLQGEEEEIGPWLPATRTIKGVTSLLGINEGRGLNIEGAIREQMGLHPFDQWEDYRPERMMISMMADGTEINGMPITAEMIERAMIEKVGPLWAEANRRAGKEWGFSQVMGSITGVPAMAYPTGEEEIRRQKELYEQAWKKYEAGDHQAVNRFMEEYPEYEARLALFKSPEERVNAFLVDQIWDTYNQLPDLDKREVRDQLGEDFVSSFLDKNTRSTGSLPPDMLGVWLKMMGGDPPGTLGDNAVPIAFAPPEISEVAQFFYDNRRVQYPDFYQQQQEYYSLSEGQARRDYKRANPKFAEYMDWRWDFLTRNPNVAPYITDNPPKFETYQDFQEAQNLPPQINYQELESVLISTDYGLLTAAQNYAFSGAMSEDLSVALSNISERSGVPIEYYLNLIENRYAALYQ